MATYLPLLAQRSHEIVRHCPAHREPHRARSPGYGSPHPPTHKVVAYIGEHGQSTPEVCCGSTAHNLILP
jgi:hypothetical protein